MSKKAFFTIVTLLIIIIGCGNESKTSEKERNTSVSGVIIDGVGKQLIFEKLQAQGVVPIDTVKLDESGKFEFKTDVDGQEFYRIQIAPNNFVVLILSEDDNIILNSSAKALDQNYEISGSEESQRLQRFNKFMNSLYFTNDSLTKAMKMHQANRDINAYIGATQFQQTLYSKKDEFIRKFVDENPESLASLAAVENLNPETDYTYFKKVAVALSKKIPESPYFQNLNQRVSQWGKLAVGSEAPDISLPTPSGEIASLKDLRGKIVLLDFWASWCRPCRAENPNVVKMYNKYHNKGFEVFSVSLDKAKPAWVNAIKQDGLTWIHVSDLKYWQSVAAKKYNIKGIPQTYLLDKNGIIIAKNLRGSALEQKLTELFDK